MNLNFSSTNANQLKPLGDQDGKVICIANISPKERKKRLDFAIRQFMVATVLLITLVYFDVHILWRLPLFFVFATSAASFFQWQDKT